MIITFTNAHLLLCANSGEIEVDDNVGEEMAPVEEMDFSEDENLDILDENEEETEDTRDDLISEVKHPISHLPSATNSHNNPGPTLSATKERDDFFTARQLRIALFALCDGLRQASRVFSTEMHLIWAWLKDAKKRIKESEQEQKAHTDGEDRMVAWVMSMREQQLPITESSLFHKASALKKKGGFSDSFRISYVWAVNFMLQHRLGVRSIGRAASLARTLPVSLESKVKTFRKFTQKIIKVHKLSENTVAAMDELCLFVDLRLVQDKSRRSEALELTGTLPLVTVYLTILANGTMLPSLVQVNRHLADKTLPEFILLEAGSESLSVEEALDLWVKKIWLQHGSGSTQATKSMLVLDRHREHMGDQFLTSISGSGTLPAVVPGGCSFCLNPLEVCLKPVLQRFLLSRWANFIAGDPKELEETLPTQLHTNVAELLVDWVVEALTQLNKLPQLWIKSFHLTGFLKDVEKKDQATNQKPQEIQLDLIESLTEALLGSEILEADWSSPLELEDEEEHEDRERPEEVDKQWNDKRKETDECEREDKVKDNAGKDSEEKDDEEMEEEVNKKLEDSEEEGKETEPDRKEVNKERRETRIVIGEEVGDEWKIKSRTEGVEADREDDNRTDDSCTEDEDVNKCPQTKPS